MGTTLTNAVDVDNRDRAGGEQGDQAWLERWIKNYHSGLVKVVDQLPKDQLDQMKELLDVENLTDFGEVNSAPANMSEEDREKCKKLLLEWCPDLDPEEDDE